MATTPNYNRECASRNARISASENSFSSPYWTPLIKVGLVILVLSLIGAFISRNYDSLPDPDCIEPEWHDFGTYTEIYKCPYQG